jgi:hypothetical protein
VTQDAAGNRYQHASDHLRNSEDRRSRDFPRCAGRSQCPVERWDRTLQSVHPTALLRTLLPRVCVAALDRQRGLTAPGTGISSGTVADETVVQRQCRRTAWTPGGRCGRVGKTRWCHAEYLRFALTLPPPSSWNPKKCPMTATLWLPKRGRRPRDPRAGQRDGGLPLRRRALVAVVRRDDGHAAALLRRGEPVSARPRYTDRARVIAARSA